MVKRSLILFCLLYQIRFSYSQNDTLQTSPAHSKRVWLVAGANAAFYTGTYLALNKAWYADYDRAAFHFFNDNPEWNQMDKAGHVWSTYQVGRLSAEMWKWTGIDRTTSAWLGGASGIVYQSIIEIQDAYSAKWGFSWGDVGANVAGAGLFVLQELTWKEQKVQVKLGFYGYDYPGALKTRRNELFGKSFAERLLKDYNAQTYWLTTGLTEIFPGSGLPPWLNIAAGYASEGMYGGRSNVWTDSEGAVIDFSHVRRLRKFYLSPDIDLTKIKVRSRLLRSVFFVLNAVKIPAPALELRGGRFAVRVR